MGEPKGDAEKSAMTVRDLVGVLKRANQKAHVWIGICEMCESELFSLTGPRIACPNCGTETTVRPLMVYKRTAHNGSWWKRVRGE